MVMTQGLAVELARFKIRVNCVCPLASDTAFFKSVSGLDRMSDDVRKRFESDVPLRRLTDPDDVANAMLYPPQTMPRSSPASASTSMAARAFRSTTRLRSGSTAEG